MISNEWDSNRPAWKQCTGLTTNACVDLIGLKAAADMNYFRVEFLSAHFCARLTMLERAISKGRSVCLSVCHTRDPRLNGSRYPSIFHTIRQSAVSNLLKQNFIFVNLECVKERYVLPCRKQIFDQSSTITLEQFDIGCKLVLLTAKKKSHCTRLVPKSVTLNDLEQHNGCYNALLYTECVSF